MKQIFQAIHISLILFSIWLMVEEIQQAGFAHQQPLIPVIILTNSALIVALLLTYKHYQ